MEGGGKGYRWYFRHSPGAGRLEGASAVGESRNTICGDNVRLYLSCRGGVIEEAAFEASGCSGAIASASALTQLLKGTTAEEAMEKGGRELEKLVPDLPSNKKHGLLLALEALRDALQNLEGLA